MSIDFDAMTPDERAMHCEHFRRDTPGLVDALLAQVAELADGKCYPVSMVVSMVFGYEGNVVGVKALAGSRIAGPSSEFINARAMAYFWLNEALKCAERLGAGMHGDGGEVAK